MINAVCEIHGVIKTAENVSGFISGSGNMTGTVAIGSGFVTDKYTGEYVVIPKADNEQILKTANKLMSDDVTVKKVPYFETSNQYGETVYIASEV